MLNSYREPDAKSKVRQKAQRELKQAIDWYEAQAQQLSVGLIEDVDGIVQVISEFPLAFPMTDRELRRATSHDYPYSLRYRVKGDLVEVVAFTHEKRHPEAWKG